MDVLSAEYGWTIEEIKKRSRREISDIFRAMNQRRGGYENIAPLIEMTEDKRKKIEQAMKERFK